MKSSVATKDEEIAAATATAEEGKAALESAQQELAAANDKVTALEAQLEEAKNVSSFSLELWVNEYFRLRLQNKITPP